MPLASIRPPMVTVRFWQTIHTRASSLQPSLQSVSELGPWVIRELAFETITSFSTVRQVFQFVNVSTPALVTVRDAIHAASSRTTLLADP